MAESFNWREFEKTEVERIISEIDAIEQTESKIACPNHSGESTMEAFDKALVASIDIFAEKTRNLR